MRHRVRRSSRSRHSKNSIRRYRLKKRKIKRKRARKQPSNQTTLYLKGYYKGRNDGEYSGGEGILDALLPGDAVLPEISIDAVIAAGLEQMRPQLYPLIHVNELSEQIIHALKTNSPMSIVRLGDGELLTLAQDVVLSPAEVLKRGPFLSYAGVEVPDIAARDQLLHAIREADVIGIPKLRMRDFQPLAFSVFRAHGIDYRSLKLADSLVNYHIYQAGYLSRIVNERRVLTVGNLASELANILRGKGVSVVGAVTPVRGVKDIHRVMEEIRKKDFDIALISAGISAVILAQKVASDMGKVAIDFGHLADSIVRGEAPYF